jgi:hypothetical protein
MCPVADVKKTLESMRNNPRDVRFAELKKVCKHYFGQGRQLGGSHVIFKMQWAGDPRVNIQEGKSGRAKEYQVKQVLEAIAKLEANHGKQS